jgi:putative restriction endonuclease
MTPTADHLLDAFAHLRRARRGDAYAPHKPLLLLWALARLQRGEPERVAFTEAEGALKHLLERFGPSGASKSRHYPFWHLATDDGGRLWTLDGPPALLARAAGATPNLGELRVPGVAGGFAPDVVRALRAQPWLLQTLAEQLLEQCFPPSLHADIADAVGLRLGDAALPLAAEPDAPRYRVRRERERDRRFRERVLQAYGLRCGVCGFDLRLDAASAALEAAHIQWLQYAGPDDLCNGIALCALHHKLFDLGVFTVMPEGLRVVYSRRAEGSSAADGELRHHGRALLAPAGEAARPAPRFLQWNFANVFKQPALQP